MGDTQLARLVIHRGDKRGDKWKSEWILRLGRSELKQIGPVAKPTVIYDDDLKGFGLRIMPPSSRNSAGTRSWFVEFRPGGGGRAIAKRRLVIGRADAITPERARQSAKDILARARLGQDPAAERSQARQAKTVAELGSDYLAQTNVLRKPRTAELYLGLWRRYIVPEIGSIKLAELRRSDVEAMHRRVGARHQSTANRLVVLTSHFFAWAQDRGEAPKGANPARGVRKFREQGRERYLTADELRRLGSAIRQGETVGFEWTVDPKNPKAKHAPKSSEARRVRLSIETAAALRLLLLTGARLREILHLQWSHVDIERGMLFLPDSKTGRKTLVLGRPALEVLQLLHERRHAALEDAAKLRAASSISDFVIPAEDPKKPRADLKRPWRLVTRAAKLDGVRLHDLRHSFASVGAGAGMGLPLIGKLLGHSNQATTARYAHLDADPVRRASDIVSTAIAAALDGPNTEGER